MSNRPQFTVRDLLIWTTILAIGIVLLKLVYDLEVYRPFSGAVEIVLFFPASIVFPFGAIGIFVVPVGMLVMLAAMTSENSRTSSNGLFLTITAICWGAVVIDGDPHINSYLLMQVGMSVCSAICFIEAYYRTRSGNPDIRLDTTRLYTSAITSVVVVVATNLCWGTGIMLSQM